MSEKSLNIVFMGTPEFSVGALRALIASHHKVVCVYSQPPRPKGRGQQLQKSPVHLAAEEAGIPVRNPLSLKKDEGARAEFAALNADVAVVAAYGLILPKAVLDAPKYGCINIHASLLPRWRGASPIQRAIWAGDSETGITIMQMEEGLDTGPMIAKRIISITGQTTTPLLHDQLAALGAEMIVPVLDQIAAQGRVTAESQDESLTCYAPLLNREDGKVDWTQSAQAIDRQIRALNPWPGVWTATPDGKRLKIIEGVSEDSLNRADPPLEPGRLLDRVGHVACGGGTALRLVRVQPDNARSMDVAGAVNGHYLTLDAVFA